MKSSQLSATSSILLSRAMRAAAGLAFFWTCTGAQASNGETPAPAPLVAADRVLVAALKQIVLAADEARALQPGSTPADTSEEVRVSGFDPTTTERLTRAVAPYVGQPVSKDLLSRLRAAIEAVSTGETGRFFVARYPRQSITQGRVALVVTLQRDPHTEPLRSADASGAPTGVVPILRSGATNRGTRFFIGVDNQLSRDLGDERIYAGAQLNNVFDPRSTLGVLLMATPDSDIYRGGSLNHGFKFSEHWRLDLGASASEVDNTEGTITSRRSLIKVEPVVTRRFDLGGQVWHEVRLGMEWRADHAEVTQGALSRSFELPGFLIQPGWAGSLPDRMGRTRLDIGLNCNTGWLGTAADYRSYKAQDASYVTLRAEAARITKLGTWGQLVMRGTVQFSDQDIPALDHFYGSGQAGVRGYDENRYHGADAWFASAEHKGPRFPLAAKCTLQPVWFMDAAGFHGAGANDNIAGAGIGVRLHAGEGFTLRLDAARAVGDRAAQDDLGLVHFSVSQRW